MQTPARAHENVRVFPLVLTQPRYAKSRARVFTSEELELDTDVRELFDAVRDDEGQPPTPEFERVARGDRWPLRIFARYVVRAAKHGADEERVLAIVERLARFVRDVFRKHGSRRKAA